MEKMKKVDGPNFAVWSHENLAKFAKDAYWRMQEQQDAMEESRRDLKDAMNIIRLRLLAAPEKKVG